MVKGCLFYNKRILEHMLKYCNCLNIYQASNQFFCVITSSLSTNDVFIIAFPPFEPIIRG